MLVRLAGIGHGVLQILSSWCRSPRRPLPAMASSSTERPDISSTSCRK